ncbi:MAG: type II secretion system protein [Patescibacteria group bacterium]
MKRNLGLTLIELLTVMAIIALLSTVVLSNYREGQKRYALAQAAQKMASDFRRAQNMAISGINIGNGKYCGYGISFPNDNSYIVYAEEFSPCNQVYNSSDPVIEEVFLPVGIRIKSTSPNKVYVFYKAPEPITSIKTGVSSGTIVLEVTDTLLPTKRITATNSGLVQVD